MTLEFYGPLQWRAQVIKQDNHPLLCRILIKSLEAGRHKETPAA